ncbi:hypothetical protein [Draconibacterium mangrovi]|uniref:hypothetical protein n=1 Tax=Draconibacterium mangrovi TaxID=2697469 RepID=UPI0013D2EAE2|nr:hypothetical protein [Draconibacterium mangrovi]
MTIVNDDKENNGFTPIEPDEKQKAAYWGNQKGAYWGNNADADGISELKDRQGNGVADFNELQQQSAQVQQGAEQPTQNKSYLGDPEELINQIYTPAPKPYFDTEAADYKKRAAKLNALGQGLSGVADIISLARGGQVNAPVQNNKVPAYINSYWNQRNDYLRRMDDWNNRDAANKSLAARVALNQYNTDRNYGLAAGRAANDDKWKQLQYLQKEGYNQWLKDKHTQDSEESRRRWEVEMDWKMKLPYINAALAKDKMWWKVQYDNDKKIYTLLDENGVARHQLAGDGDIQKLYSLIVDDPKMAQTISGRMKQLKSQFGEGVNMNHMKVIVSEFWDKVPNAAQYLNRGQKRQPVTQGDIDNIQGYSARPFEYPIVNMPESQTQPSAEDWSQYELQ